MIARKKRRMIIIGSIITFLVIVAIVILLLYLNTDMFKSNQTLFMKYISKNIENAEATFLAGEDAEFKNMLKTSPYGQNIIAKVNYTENIGKTSESTQNSINTLQLEIESQVDETNEYQYHDVQLVNNEENLFEIEYLENSGDQAIKFSDLFRQYVVMQNSTLQELLEVLGYQNENLDLLQPDMSILENIKLTDEEKSELQEKYLQVIMQGLEQSDFSKQSNVTITIDEKNVFTDAYTLTLTKEQLNNLYINMLETIKNDEMILTKIRLIDGTYNTSFEEELTTLINTKIEEINRSNIGQDETKITVYENQKETVRTDIQTNEYTINIDWLKQENTYFAQLQIIQNEKETNYSIRNDNEKTEIKIEDEEKEITLTKTTSQKQAVTNVITALYEDDENRVEARVQIDTDFSQQINQVDLENEETIILNELETEQLTQIVDRIDTAMQEKIQQITTEISADDITKILNTVGIMQEEARIESEGVSETEKVRYNSQFEILQGEKLKMENILTVIDAIKNNLINIEPVSNTEIKLKIDRNEGNEQIVNTLTEYIEKNRNWEYNLALEYDENGLVNYMILSIVN